MKIEDIMKCEKCDKDTVYLVRDSSRKEVRFYQEPHINEQEIRYPDVNLKRKSSREGPEHYDVMIHCPICGEPIGDYVGVPLGWTCLDTPGPLLTTPR